MKRMKRNNFLAIVLIIALGLIFSGNCTATDTYGNVKLTGVDIAGSNYVFYASEYTQNGYNSNLCAKTDWWWPPGTKYAFWMPKEGNDEIYRQLLAAYLTGRKVFINASVQNLSYACGIPCLMTVGKTFAIGNY